MKRTGILSVSLLMCMLSACAWYDRNFGTSQAAQQPGARARMSVTTAPVAPAAAEAIHAMLSGTVYAALRGDTDALINNLAPEDKTRIGAMSEADRNMLSGVSRQYSSNWDSRYSKVYEWNSASEARQVFGNYQLSRAESGPYAFVTIPASHGLPAATLRLRDLGNNTWRINAPDALTAVSLKDRLNTALVDLNNSANNWPSDKNEAARMAAHRILGLFSRA